MTALAEHNLDGLYESDFRAVVLENIQVAMHLATGEKTRYSRSGKSTIFTEPYRLNGRPDLATWPGLAVMQAEEAGLQYRYLPRAAVEAFRAYSLTKAEDPEYLSELHQCIDDIFIQADRARLALEEDNARQVRAAEDKARRLAAEAEQNARNQAWIAANFSAEPLTPAVHRPYGYPSLSEIFGRRTETGLISVLYIEDGFPVASMDAEIYDALDGESVRRDHAEGIVITEADARATGLSIE